MLINSAGSVVTDALRGMALAHPELEVDVRHRIVTRAGGPVAGRVAVMSGGGSGHEPLHCGFVGEGGLAAACPGEVFTSPVPEQFARAVARVDSGAGVVCVVKNYAGDVLNFEAARELAEARGHRLARVLVADDVAENSGAHGRRGTGATVFVHKITGAAAAEGRSLEDVAAVGLRVSAGSRSFGVALSAATTPAKGTATFELPHGQMEFAIGIHGEPGQARGPVMTARETALHSVEALCAPEVPGRLVLLLVNGMGATPLLELYGYHAEVHKALASRGIQVARSLVGNYVTSLDMAGVTVTVCEVDEDLLRLYDAPVRTPALRWGG